MKLFLTILLNTFVATLIVYLLIVIVDVSFVCSFCSIMKQHAHDLTVILTNKRDNLIRLVELINKNGINGIKLDKKKVDSLSNFDLKRIENHDGEDARLAREELTSLNEYLLSICGANTFKEEDEEIQRVLANINELEKVYRHHLMMYNADVLGYNFWISFFPTRFIYLILKFKPKENI